MPTEELDVEALARDLPKTNELREDSALEWHSPESDEYDQTFVPDLDAFYTYADYLRMELKGAVGADQGILKKDGGAAGSASGRCTGKLFATLDLRVLLKGAILCQVRDRPLRRSSIRC